MVKGLMLHTVRVQKEGRLNKSMFCHVTSHRQRQRWMTGGADWEWECDGGGKAYEEREDVEETS